METNPERQEQEAFEFDIDAVGADGLVSGVQGQELQLKSNDQGQEQRYKDTEQGQDQQPCVPLELDMEMPSFLVDQGSPNGDDDGPGDTNNSLVRWLD